MDYTYLDCLALLGVGGAHPGGLKLTKDILSKENIDQTKTFLDIGCGTGQTSAYLKKKYNCDVTGLDNSQIMVNKAKQRFLSMHLPVEIVLGNAEKLLFNDHLFDIVLSESVLTFTDVSLSIVEINRVLQKNGVLLAIEMTLEDSTYANKQKIKDFYGMPELLTAEEWIKAFRNVGFTHVSVKTKEIQFHEDDLEHAADFSLSNNINNECFEILKQHEQLSMDYKDILGFRIFRCTK